MMDVIGLSADLSLLTALTYLLTVFAADDGDRGDALGAGLDR